jgi:hypothetical protein
MPSHLTLGGACGRRQPRHGSIHQGFSFDPRASLNQEKKSRKKAGIEKEGPVETRLSSVAQRGSQIRKLQKFLDKGSPNDRHCAQTPKQKHRCRNYPHPTVNSNHNKC